MPKTFKEEVEQFARDSVNALPGQFSGQNIYGDPDTRVEGSLYRWLSSKLSGGFDFIEKRAARSNLRLKEALKNTKDPNEFMRIYLRMSLKASDVFLDEALDALRNKADVSSLACCLIQSLVRIDRSEAAGLSSEDYSRLRRARRTLVVILTLARVIRNSSARGIGISALDYSLNIVKLLSEAIMDLAGGLFYITITFFHRTIMQKISRMLIRNSNGILGCSGMISLISVFINALLNDHGLFPKMRTYLYAASLRIHRNTYKAINDITSLKTVRYMDMIIWVLNSLIEAIDSAVICTPKAYTPVTQYKQNTASSSTASTQTPSPAQQFNQQQASGGTSAQPLNPSAIGFQRSPLEYNIQPTSVTVQSNYGPSTIEVSRLFTEPTAEDIEQFLVRYLNVPPIEARNVVKSSANGNCLERLDAEQQERVQRILSNLEINL